MVVTTQPGPVLIARLRKTEIGVVPDDWDVCELGKIADIIMGQSPPGESYNTSGVGTPLINGPTEFMNKHPIPVQWTTRPTKLSRKGDVLVCVRGSSTGRINISDRSYCIGRGVAAIRSRFGGSDGFLTYLVLNSIPRILSFKTGSTFPN